MDYLKNFIVKGRSVFLPLIFTDVYVSAKCLVIGGVTLARNINDKRKSSVDFPVLVKQNLSEYMSPQDYDNNRNVLKLYRLPDLKVII